MATSTGALLLRGSTLRTVNLGLNIVVAFFLMPFMIGELGQRYYGMWTLVASIIGYFGFLDFGLSKAAQQLIAKAVGRDSDEEVTRIISTALAVFLLLGFVAFTTSVVIGLLAGRFFSDPVEIERFRSVMLLLGSSTLLTFPMMAFHGLFSAHLRYDVVSLIEVAKLLVRTGLIVWVLHAGYSIVGLAVVAVAADVGTHLVKLAVIRWLFGSLHTSPRRLQRGLIRPLFNYGGNAFLHSIADLLRFQIDGLVVAGFLGLSAAAVYNVAGQLAQYFRTLLGTVFGVATPVFARQSATNDRSQMLATFRFATKLAACLAVTLVGATILLGKPFLNLWLGPDFADAYAPLIILIVGTLFHVSNEPALALLYGVARHGPYARVAMGESLVNVALSIFLVSLIGLPGVALGTSIPMLISAGFIGWYATRFLRHSLRRHLAILVKIYGLGGLVGLVAWRAQQHWAMDSYLDLLGFGAAITVANVCVFLVLVFNQQEREQIFGTLRVAAGMT